MCGGNHGIHACEWEEVKTADDLARERESSRLRMQKWESEKREKAYREYWDAVKASRPTPYEMGYRASGGPLPW